MPGRLIPCTFGTLVNTTEKRPPGYSHGVCVELRPGYRLYVSSGTTDIDGEQWTTIKHPIGGAVGDDPAVLLNQRTAFLAQLNGALSNIVTALVLAGGQPGEIFEVNIFCVDECANYFEDPEVAPLLGPIWLKHLGRNFPAVYAVGVERLVNPDALVEIQVRALIPPARTA